MIVAPAQALEGEPCIRRAERRLLGIIVASLGLYIATWLLERAIFGNRLPVPASVADPANAGNRTLLLWQMTSYAVVTVFIFWAYLMVMRMCRRGEIYHGLARRLAFAGPVLLNLLCFAWLPLLSDDAFSYLAHGVLGLIPGHNPLLEAPEAVRHTIVGSRLSAFEWRVPPDITPYGVLWTRLEMAVAKLCAGNVVAAILAFKAIALAASLGSARMIWLILGRTHPNLQLQGTLAYLWNPLIIIEFAGAGHNDALMVFFSIAAMAACVAYRPTISIIAQLLGAMTKYTSLLFLPAQLRYLWHSRRSAAQLTLQVATAIAVTVAVALILYAPLWTGLHTFQGIVRRADPVNTVSLASAVARVLRHSPLEPIAGPIAMAVVTVPLVVLVAWTALQVKNAADLGRACAWISLAYLLVASPDYWPWYACMPIAWIMIGEPSRLFWLALMMSLMARLVAPVEILHTHGYLSWPVSKAITAAMGSLIPLIALAGWLWRQRQPRRSPAS